MELFAFVVLLVAINRGCSVPSEVQENAVTQLIQRRLPNHHFLFVISIDEDLVQGDRDTFRISSPKAFNDSRVHITGNTGVAAAWGFLYYLKNFCKGHVSWEADQLNLPNPLPTAQVKVTANELYRYYQNVCTFSYSFVWWDWPRWERHLDWMAMNGINLALAFTGQEAIWRRVYLDLNVTQTELDEHFAGPAFLAWGRMGNIRGWGGPLTDSWHEMTQKLQNKILRRMTEFGMTRILPAFAGHIPRGILRQYPTANYSRLSTWGHFDEKYTRTYMLSPTDPLFGEIGQKFIREMQKEYNGTDHVYNCDPFNEVTPPSGDPNYIQEVAKAIFGTMTSSDPHAIWIMQGWMFRDTEFWTYERARALLTSVPLGRMIILDLDADLEPQYSHLDSFFGQPFIFCYLGNYGGVDGMYGNVDILLENLASTRNDANASLIGTGISSEGINQNYVLYDFFLELAYRKAPFNLRLWVREYCLRRYGASSYQDQLANAWQKLWKSVYNSRFKLRHKERNFLLPRRPNLKNKFKISYNVSELIEAWDIFIDSCKHNLMLSNASYVPILHNGTNVLGYQDDLTLRPTFQHDLVDITREVLQVLGNQLVRKVRKHFQTRSIIKLRRDGDTLIGLLSDLDRLLASSKDFILGDWLQRADSWATNEEERIQYLRNSLHQLSLWGPKGEILDYAVKQWAGVVEHYFKPRWALFIDEIIDCLKENHTKFDQKQFNEDVFVGVEKVFANGVDMPFSPVPKGDAVVIAKTIHKKYRAFFSPNLLSRLKKQFHRHLKKVVKFGHLSRRRSHYHSHK